MSKKTYTIPCTWQVTGFITVEADNLIEAVNFARDDAPLPDQSEYLEGSFEIDHHMISYYNENLTAEEKKDCNVIRI